MYPKLRVQYFSQIQNGEGSLFQWTLIMYSPFSSQTTHIVQADSILLVTLPFKCILRKKRDASSPRPLDPPVVAKPTTGLGASAGVNQRQTPDIGNRPPDTTDSLTGTMIGTQPARDVGISLNFVRLKRRDFLES